MIVLRSNEGKKLAVRPTFGTYSEWTVHKSLSTFYKWEVSHTCGLSALSFDSLQEARRVAKLLAARVPLAPPQGNLSFSDWRVDPLTNWCYDNVISLLKKEGVL